MGRVKYRKCREPDWLRDLEARLCSVIVIISFTVAVISLALFTDSTILSLSVELTPAICVTTDVKNLSGITKCLWTSCRQSCTATVYNCSQIYVNYTLNDTDVNDNISFVADNGTYAWWSPEENSLYRDVSSEMKENFSLIESDDNVNSSVPLYVNVNGCGYEPEVSCTNFYQQYGNVGISFHCEVSFNVDPPIVIPDSPLSIDTDKTALVRYLILSLMPLVFFFVCCLYVYWRKLFRQKTKKVSQLSEQKKRIKRSGTFSERRVQDMNMLQEPKRRDSSVEVLSVRSVQSPAGGKHEVPSEACPSFINVPVLSAAATNIHVSDREQFL
jgi:hypothetical protein